MERTNFICFIISVALVASNSGTILSWNIFQSEGSENALSNLRNYTSQRLAALRNLRDQLNNSKASDRFPNITKENAVAAPGLNKQGTPKKSSVELAPTGREVISGSLFRNLDKLFSLAAPIKKMITSPEGIESLASMVIPKRDMLQKLIEIKGHLEPSVKRYLTDTYNGFLNHLIPYSNNIGVPPFVLNSMKIPQGLDPRWQLIKSIIKSEDGIEKFLHSIVSGEALKKLPDVVESRSGDETELISDQEPDANGQPYRKHQQMYLSAFKKRLMKPGEAAGARNRYRYMSTTGGVMRPSMDYENIVDQNGQLSQVSYDVRNPDEMIGETAFPPGATDMDMMLMSASGHGGGRGHGHHGGNGHASYGGFLDPFTILGGLAFLTYLGLMLQNSLNNNGGMAMTMGRSSFSWNWENALPASSENYPIAKLNSGRTKRNVNVSWSTDDNIKSQRVGDDNVSQTSRINFPKLHPNRKLLLGNGNKGHFR